MIKENRFQSLFSSRKESQKPIFSAFLTSGFPSLKHTESFIKDFEKNGVDLIELGYPFSDPLADGPTIQASSEAALKKGLRMNQVLNMVKRLRAQGIKIPIVMFTYLNPVFHYGYQKFVKKLKESGFDGLLIPDLPPEEESVLNRACRKEKVPQIYLVAPTTDRKRAAKISRASKGFIYYVSLKGVTGARAALPKEISKQIKTLKKISTKSVLVGFGISSPEQAKSLGKVAEGIIVGSAIIDKISKSNGSRKAVTQYVRKMAKAVKGRI